MEPGSMDHLSGWGRWKFFLRRSWKEKWTINIMAGINLQKYRKQGLEVLIADIYFLSQSRSPFSNLWLQTAEYFMIIVFFYFQDSMMWIYNLFLYLFSESCAFNPVVKLTGLANLGLVTKTMILSDAVYLHNLTILFFRWGGGGETKEKCPWSRSITGGPCFVLTRFLLPVFLYF